MCLNYYKSRHKNSIQYLSSDISIIHVDNKYVCIAKTIKFYFPINLHMTYKEARMENNICIISENYVNFD